MLVSLAAVLALLPLVTTTVDLTDFNRIYNDAQAENDYLNSLSTTAPASASQVVTINQYFKTTSKDINTTIHDTLTTPSLGGADCYAIDNSLATKACPTFKALCNNFIAHYV